MSTPSDPHHQIDASDPAISHAASSDLTPTGLSHSAEEASAAGAERTRRPTEGPTGGEAPPLDQPPPDEVEGATPPGYDWPTHGGYLGCLVGALASCPIVGFIGANIWALFHLSWLAFPVFALLMLASVAAVVAAARLGWVLGRRFYRYYPQPQPTWGESDAAAEALDAQSAAKPREERRPFVP